MDSHWWISMAGVSGGRLMTADMRKALDHACVVPYRDVSLGKG